MGWRIPGGGARTFAAGICTYLICLIALAPASTVDAALQRAGDGRLRLAEAQGTLWSGTGQLEIRDTTGHKGVGRNLSWHFHPQSLLRGRLGFEVDIGTSHKPFLLGISLLGLDIADADFVLPAAGLGIALPSLAALKPTGDLWIHIARFSDSSRGTSGSVIVEWRDAGSALTPVSPLGTYELRIEGTAGGLKTSLRTLKGPLRLEGSGSRGTSGNAVFFATARVDAHYQPQLEPLLRLFAVERGDGSFEVRVK